MLYALLREAAGIALRWYYSEVAVRGVERVPRDGALLVVGNHPNALIDALLIGWALPRRVRITAKATIFTNSAFAAFLRTVGVIPLRRASDEMAGSGGAGGAAPAVDPSRNREAFRAVIEAFEQRRAVLIFPEGKSHDEPSIAAIRTGPARMALEGLSSPRVESMKILPVGLVFERKEVVRSRVLVEIGEPFMVEGHHDVPSLTTEIDRRLRALTLNFPTWEEARETAALAELFLSVLEPSPTLDRSRQLARQVDVARRVTESRRRLATAPPELARRIDAFLHRVGVLTRELEARGTTLHDAGISLGIRKGARFALRESAVLLLAGPVALWGRVNHWIPFTAARAIAQRDVTAQDQPAMRTIVAGFVLVLAAYAIQTAVVWAVAGSLVAIAYILSLPISADVDLRLRDRVRRAARRMRGYRTLRRDRAFVEWMRRERAELGAELVALESALATRTTGDQPEAGRAGR
jgi:glycerol-3-phosphate O-acyltransferase / dihydroxyacetone phosphate acyltransferase